MVAHSRLRRAAILAALFAAAGMILARVAARSEAGTLAQTSPTPIQLQFPTPTETAGPPTETPTRTPTSEGRPFIEALQDATNVRTSPDIGDNLLAQIFPGTRYPVVGKYFQWYMIEFPNSPNGIAWVHESVVSLIGDEAMVTPIPDLGGVPTLDPAYVAGQETAAAVTSTPGAIATLTAQVLITPTGIFTADPGATATLAPGERLPTFTFPAQTPTPVVIPRTAPVTEQSGGVPPIIPILALGALGLMGLLVGLMRRL